MPEQPYRDAMTPRERMTAFYQRKPIDRTPFVPMAADNAGQYFGLPIDEYSRSASLMADSHIALYRAIESDAITLGGGWKAVAEALGATLGYPVDNTPYVKTHPIQDKAGVEQLAPLDPHRDGRLPLYLEALERVLEQVGQEVEVHVQVGNPLSLAAALRGTETLLKDFYQDPEGVHALLRKATDSLLSYCEAIIAKGGLPWTSEPVASGTMVSPKHFRQFPLPYLQEVQNYLKEHTGQGQLHICGSTHKIWGLMAETGATVLSIDDAEDLKAARDAVGDRVGLMGNVPPITLLYGTPADVLRESQRCLEAAADNPAGFILSSGCVVPIGTPVDNLRAMLQAVRQAADVRLHA